MCLRALQVHGVEERKAARNGVSVGVGAGSGAKGPAVVGRVFLNTMISAHPIVSMYSTSCT